MTVIRERVAGEPPGPAQIDGVRLVERQFWLPRSRLGLLRGWLRLLFLNAWIVKNILGGGYRIVVATDVHTALALILIRRLKPFRFVFDSHEIMWGLGEGRLLSGLYKLAEKVTLRHCDLWLVPSATRAEIVLKEQNLRKNYLVCRNLPTVSEPPVDPPPYRARLQELGVPTDRFIVFFQGSLVPRRGVEVLLDAARSGQYHVVVQGEGSLRSALDHNRYAGVTLLPPCENTEAVSWLSAADLSFVYYDNNCLNNAQACSSKFYASVFAGIPILCNRLPAFLEFAEKYGGVVFFDELDCSVINAQIEALAKDTVHYRTLCREVVNARQVLHMEFANHAGQIRDAFRALVGILNRSEPPGISREGLVL